MSETLLKFSPAKSNAKLAALGGVVYTFSLPSGWSCPGAKDCLSRSIQDKSTGKYKILDGKDTQFRCFSATQEVVYNAVREQRQHNYDLLRKAKTAPNMFKLIKNSLPKKATVIRIHVGGDFFNEDYMKAWAAVAASSPKITFYAYTKSLNYWVNLKEKGQILSNFKLNASKGGKYDHLIAEHNLKYAEVVYTEQEAIDKGLEIDHDDSHAFLKDTSFALLLHGVQPKGSTAAEALKSLKGKGSYSKTKTDGQNSTTSKSKTTRQKSSRN